MSAESVVVIGGGPAGSTVAALVATEEIGDRLRIGSGQRPRRIGVRGWNGRILALQLEQGDDLVEQVGGRAGVHAARNIEGADSGQLSDAYCPGSTPA